MAHFRSTVYLILAGALLLVSLLGAQVTGSVWSSDAAEPGGTVPTRTPKPPEPVAVNLIVALQRPNAPPPHPSWAVPVHFAFYAPGDAETALYAWDLTLDQSGAWQGTLTMSPGTYDVRLKNMHTLRNVKRNVTISDPVTIDMGTLREGDADDDNRVRSSDFGILRAAYFTSEGDPGFDPRTDFDEDNRIRSSDFALLRGNYFETGDLEVAAGLAGGAGRLKPQQPLLSPPAWTETSGFVALAGTVDLALEPARVQVAPGETFTLTLIAHAGNQPFVVLDVDIRFPPALLQVVGPDGEPVTEIQALPPVDTLSINRVNNTTGRILYGAGVEFLAAPVNGNVPLAHIRFKALQVAPVAEIRLVDGEVSDEDGKHVTGPLLGTSVRIGDPGWILYQPLIQRTN